MLLKYFYDKKLAQASYLVGCQQTGEALVIDAARNIAPYLQLADDEGLHITHITETHIHADFVSGSRELAAKTGAILYLSDMGDDQWKYQFLDSHIHLIKDGDSWMVGNILVDVIATPGHTPEHVIFQITDTAAGNSPMGLFTGDCLFVGSIGRPDLLEKAAGFKDTMETGARQQFHNIQKLLDMPDYLQIWPGHGAGSACGKSLGALPSSTLGYEKRVNQAFHFDDEATFAEWLLDGQPEPPAYFAQMKKVNKIGPALLRQLPIPQQLPPEQWTEILEQNHLIIDIRPRGKVAQAYIPGTLSIPLESTAFNTYVGWFVKYDAPLYLVASPADFELALPQLRAIGVDMIGGYFDPAMLTTSVESILQISPEELYKRQHTVQIIDVRNQDEYQTAHLPNAIHMMLGYLPAYLDTISRDKLVVVNCKTGVRSHIATSFLKKHSFTQVGNLEGGLEAWTKAGLPVTLGKPEFVEM